MIKHWKYLMYLLKHKFYVAIECVKMGLYWHALTHDLSKFRPSEWIPYTRYFYGNYPSLDDIFGDQRNNVSRWKEDVEKDFDIAWLQHQKRNQHHWQYWILHEDSGATKLLPMPVKIVKQMACDWIGASKAIRGKNARASEWYEKVKDKTLMHPESKDIFENLICAQNSLVQEVRE